jgi:hypothetical protein
VTGRAGWGGAPARRRAALCFGRTSADVPPSPRTAVRSRALPFFRGFLLTELSGVGCGGVPGRVSVDGGRDGGAAVRGRGPSGPGWRSSATLPSPRTLALEARSWPDGRPAFLIDELGNPGRQDWIEDSTNRADSPHRSQGLGPSRNGAHTHTLPLGAHDQSRCEAIVFWADSSRSRGVPRHLSFNISTAALAGRHAAAGRPRAAHRVTKVTYPSLAVNVAFARFSGRHSGRRLLPDAGTPPPGKGNGLALRPAASGGPAGR